MSDLQTQLNTVKANESWLEKIKRYIPGYDGYVNKDNARELDTILRNQLAANLEGNKTRIKNTVSSLSKNGRLFETGDIDKIDKKNENCIAQFKSAARGYSGVFDVVKIKEDKLNRLYEFDSALLADVENINSLLIGVTIKYTKLNKKVRKNLRGKQRYKAHLFLVNEKKSISVIYRLYKLFDMSENCSDVSKNRSVVFNQLFY